jgi:hypothetical protein
MSSHMDPMVNNDFEKWLNMLYGNYGAVKATRGMSHDYLGMRLDFSQTNTVTVDMRAYVVEMIEESMLNLSPKDTDITPAAEDLFAEGSGNLLMKDKAELFPKIMAKGLFLCKRASKQPILSSALYCGACAQTYCRIEENKMFTHQRPNCGGPYLYALRKTFCNRRRISRRLTAYILW